MNILTTILSLFKTSGTDVVTKNVQAATELVDDLFTSDDERQSFALCMEKLQQASQSAIARTARGSLIWSVSILLVYQSVIRDLLIGFGLTLPESTIDAMSIVTKAFALLAGVG